MTLEEFGNTSVASIPLTIAHCLSPELSNTSRRLVLAGFGVGLSWAAAAVMLGSICYTRCSHGSTGRHR